MYFFESVIEYLQVLPKAPDFPLLGRPPSFLPALEFFFTNLLKEVELGSCTEVEAMLSKTNLKEEVHIMG